MAADLEQQAVWKGGGEPRPGVADGLCRRGLKERELRTGLSYWAGGGAADADANQEAAAKFKMGNSRWTVGRD